MGMLPGSKHHAAAFGTAGIDRVCGCGMIDIRRVRMRRGQGAKNFFGESAGDYRNGVARRATPSRNLIGKLLASSWSIVTCFDFAFFDSKSSFRLSASFWP